MSYFDRILCECDKKACCFYCESTDMEEDEIDSPWLCVGCKRSGHAIIPDIGESIDLSDKKLINLLSASLFSRNFTEILKIVPNKKDKYFVINMNDNIVKHSS